MFSLSARSIPYISTLSLHDALPIFPRADESHRDRLGDVDAGIAIDDDAGVEPLDAVRALRPRLRRRQQEQDRKSTRLNSSHLVISYAVFCLKKKTQSFLL